MKKPIIAIIYDFDRTLATEDLQNFGFIPALGLTPDEFWSQTNDLSNKFGIEKILAYMYKMMIEAKMKELALIRYRSLTKLNKKDTIEV
jgi:hypothetical protein